MHLTVNRHALINAAPSLKCMNVFPVLVLTANCGPNHRALVKSVNERHCAVGSPTPASSSHFMGEKMFSVFWCKLKQNTCGLAQIQGWLPPLMGRGGTAQPVRCHSCTGPRWQPPGAKRPASFLRLTLTMFAFGYSSDFKERQTLPTRPPFYSPQIQFWRPGEYNDL